MDRGNWCCARCWRNIFPVNYLSGPNRGFRCRFPLGFAGPCGTGLKTSSKLDGEIMPIFWIPTCSAENGRNTCEGVTTGRTSSGPFLCSNHGRRNGSEARAEEILRDCRRMKRKIIITVDYEIFGNGTGDVRQHVVGPTRRMEEIADKHGIPLIIFFELEEYLAFERHAELLRNQLGYSPAALMREQAQDLARGGHDIQLHLHPEWYEARLEDGRWRLGATRTVDDLFESQEETTRYIGERKAMLETLINLGKPDRKVQVYRAGAFAAQPGRKLLTALAENGISIDSSVVKGLMHGGKTERRKQKTEISKNTNSDGPALDYRDAPCAKGPWRVKDDVAREDKSGKIWEYPIYSVMRRRMHQATPRRLRAKFSGIVRKRQQKEMAHQLGLTANRSEERRVGKECRSRWSP